MAKVIRAAFGAILPNFARTHLQNTRVSSTLTNKLEQDFTRTPHEALSPRTASQLHEALLMLFSNNPELAPTLLRLALGSDLPKYIRIQLHSGELTKVQPLEPRADLLAVFYDAVRLPVLSVVIEVQLNLDPAKRFAWPSYGTEARSRCRCPAIVLVVTPRESVARWAAEPIDLGGGDLFTPLVIGPKGIPYVTDPHEAKKVPELFVLSVMAHGREDASDRTLQVAIAALTVSVGLDSGAGSA